MLGLAGRTGLGDRIAFRHASAFLHEQRPEVGQGRAMAVVGRDRDGKPVCRNSAGERDLSGRRRPHDARASEVDVDPPMLSGRVLVVPDGVGAENRPFRGPRPGRRKRGRRESYHERHDHNADHPCRCPWCEHVPTVAIGASRGNDV
jgi:hypothetical protein